MTNTYVLAKQLAEQLTAQDRSIATAESCTGGGLAHTLTALPGASTWFKGGVVCYSNGAKSEWLDVPPNLIEQHGAVSAAVAQAMALGMCRHAESDLAISITGIAGPNGGSNDKPVGTVWVGIQLGDNALAPRHLMLTGGRAHIRQTVIHHALQWLIALTAKQ